MYVHINTYNKEYLTHRCRRSTNVQLCLIFCIYLHGASLNGWHAVFCITNNRHDVTITITHGGVKRFQTRRSLVWNRFIPHLSQVSIYHIKVSWILIIFNMGIPLLVRLYLYIETAPISNSWLNGLFNWKEISFWLISVNSLLTSHLWYLRLSNVAKELLVSYASYQILCSFMLIKSMNSCMYEIIHIWFETYLILYLLDWQYVSLNFFIHVVFCVHNFSYVHQTKCS